MKKTNSIIKFSISIGTGCYRHICVPSSYTLESFADAILWAFNFENDHAHAFFMDNKVWSDYDCYYYRYIDGNERKTNKYKLSQLKFSKGQQFKFLFDFGDEWVFQCKVLNIEENINNIKNAMLVKTCGEAPEQYSDYDDFDDGFDDDCDKCVDEMSESALPKEISPILFENAFDYYKAKVWTKLNKENIFSLELSNGKKVYCSSLGKGAIYNALVMHLDDESLLSLEKAMYAGDNGIESDRFEYSILSNTLHCNFAEKADIHPYMVSLADEYAKENGICLRKYYPDFVKYQPYCQPTNNLNSDDQAYLAEGLRAAMFLADNKIKGFVHLTPCKDGYTVSEFIPPQEKQPDYPSPFFKGKKIPKKGYFTCGVYYIPAPIYYEEEQIGRFPCVLLGFDEKDQLMTTAPQIKYNPQEMLKDFTNYFTKYCPKVITVRDDRTEALLKNYCECMDIAIMRSDFIPHLEEIYNDFCSHLDARSNDELIDERLIELVESLSAEDLSTAPLPLLEILVSDPEVPDHIRKKAEKAMKLR